jgi:predicted amidohydrolase
MVLVPSCTETPAGFTRVQVSCRARALENQIPVGQAPLTGGHPYSEFVWAGVGVAGMFVQPDVGLPSDGVLAMGDGEGWLVCEVDLPAIARARHLGHVSVREDWPEPFSAEPFALGRFSAERFVPGQFADGQFATGPGSGAA